MTSDATTGDGSPQESNRKARALALYLPQFHPIPLNDRHYGEGFTEWTHVRAARPLYPGHRQPVQPGELGYYDLRDPEVRSRQAALASDHGIEGFVYWHYWSEGERLLEMPLEEVLSSGSPAFGFCLAWANHQWHVIGGAPDQPIFVQRYGGRCDAERHFRSLEAAFHDPRYITVDGCPIFLVFRPAEIPDVGEFCGTWRELARDSGLPGMHLVAHSRKKWDAEHRGRLQSAFDTVLQGRLMPTGTRSRYRRAVDRLRGGPTLAAYSDMVDQAHHDWVELADDENWYPMVISNWDNTPRWQRSGQVLRGVTPELFGRHLGDAIEAVRSRSPARRLVFLKSWNEWAEGNYLEPDDRDGSAMLRAAAEALRDHG